MPIIINEIEVLVEVIPGNMGSSAPALPGGGKDEIIKECVEKVLEIINEKKER